MGRRSTAGSRKPATAVQDQEEESVFEIKQIHEYQLRNGQDYYLVEWEGYPLEEATWEPRNNFFNPLPDIVRRMEELKAEYAPPTKTATKVDRSPKITKVAAVEPRRVGRPAKRKRSESPGEKKPTKKKVAEDEVAGKAPVEAATAAPPPKDTSPVSLEEAPGPREAEESPESVESSGPPVSQAVPPFVKAIKKDEKHGLVAIIRSVNAEGKITEERFPIDSVKKEYPAELIEFLLQRIQFRPQGEGNSAGRS